MCKSEKSAEGHPTHFVTRRGFLEALGTTAFALGAGTALVEAADAASQKKTPPNFLFLFTDDQTFQTINALNNPDVKTPNLDRLVADGVTFTHCFNQGSWSGAVCICSRAMLNTGQYLYHAQKNIGSAPLWGETFQHAGYRTFLTGKWHNGNATALRSFEEGHSIGGGMYGAKDQYDRPKEEGKVAWQADDPANGGHWTPTVWDFDRDAQGKRIAGKKHRVNKHTSELYADEAITFLSRPAAQSEKPFFMYVSFNAPHDPRQSPKKYLEMYPPEKQKVPPTFLPEHPFDQGDHRIRDEKLAPFPRTPWAIQVHRAEYYAMITHFDAQIGRILDALDASGKRSNTYIIFSSDHGLAVGQHGLMGKQNQYDHSIRMPLILAGPDLPKGQTVDALVYLHSMFATTCELASIPVPDTVEFTSLMPLIRKEKDALHPAIFGSYRHLQRMVRTRTHKLIFYPMAYRIQLFDLTADPYEMNDISGAAANKPLIETLHEDLLRLQNEVGDTFDLDAAMKAPRDGKRATPIPVAAGKDGVFSLTPAAAQVSGSLRYQPDRNNLGAWVRQQDTAQWLLKGLTKGEYEVEFEYGCTSPGVEYEINIADASLHGTTQATGGMKTYKTFPLGRIQVSGGDTFLKIQPGKLRGPFMNYRGMRLKPVKQP